MEEVAVKVPKKPPNQLAQLPWHIIEGCQRKDRLCQKKFYEFYYGKMMGICMRYTDNYEEARDVLHEGFMKIFQNIEFFSPTVSIESWMRRIIVNTAIDHYRRNKHNSKQVEITDFNQQQPDTLTVEIISNIAVEEIMKLVQKLPPSYRTIFNLFAIEGYNHREIADMLGISQGTSKSNLSKARQLLQTMIMEELPQYKQFFNQKEKD